MKYKSGQGNIIKNISTWINSINSCWEMYKKSSTIGDPKEHT